MITLCYMCNMTGVFSPSSVPSTFVFAAFNDSNNKSLIQQTLVFQPLFNASGWPAA